MFSYVGGECTSSVTSVVSVVVVVSSVIVIGASGSGVTFSLDPIFLAVALLRDARVENAY